MCDKPAGIDRPNLTNFSSFCQLFFKGRKNSILGTLKTAVCFTLFGFILIYFPKRILRETCGKKLTLSAFGKRGQNRTFWKSAPNYHFWELIITFCSEGPENCDSSDILQVPLLRMYLDAFETNHFQNSIFMWICFVWRNLSGNFMVFSNNRQLIGSCLYCITWSTLIDHLVTTWWPFGDTSKYFR